MRRLLSLRRWTLSIIIIPSIIIGVLLGGYLTYKRFTELDQNLIERGVSLSEPLTLISALAIREDNKPLLSKALDMAHLKASPIVKSISVFLPDHTLYQSSNVHTKFDDIRIKAGRLLPENTTIEESDDKNTIYVRSPILGPESELKSAPYINKNGQGLYGYLVVELNRDQALLAQQSSLITLLLLLLGSIIIMTSLAFIFVRYIFDPIDKITNTIKKISQGDTKARVTEVMTGELELLRNSVNSVAKSVYMVNEKAEHNISEYTQELQQTVEQLEVQNIQLNMAKKEAQNANDVKSKFLANMSHELRTPLNGVLGFTRQLKKTKLNVNQSDFLDTIESSANNLLRIINDILDFSKLDAGKMEIEHIPFTLRDSINDVMTLLAPSIFDKGLDIHLNIDSRIPDELLGDPVRLKQVLINLIGNATKFTKDGFIRLDIKYLGSQELGHHIKFTVTDSGIGIDDEGKEKLFGAFGQADSSTTRKFGGTGLGLIICKKLVEAMKGGIHFNSEPNQGSKFYFDVYLKENNVEIGQPLPLKELEGKKLLYFDTCSQAFNDIKQFLSEQTDVDLVSCENEKDYKDALTTQTFDIVLIGRKVAPSTLSELKKLINIATKHCGQVYTIINSISPNQKEAIVGSGAKACFSMPIHHRKLVNTLAEPYLKEEIQSVAEQNFAGMKVLAVDDTEANLKLLSALLQEMSINCDLAKDGQEALKLAQLHRYDVIFMDIQMPVMDGITACNKIKDSSLNEATPIISVTAHAGIDEQKELMDIGFNGFLSKPIDEEMLTQVILDACPGCSITPTPSYTKPPQSMIIESELPDFINYHHLDWSLALSRAAGKQELAIEMFTMLIKSLPELYESISQHFHSNEPELLLKSIHKFHGACCYTGVPKLKQLAEMIEIGLKNNKEIDAIEPELLELLDQLEQIIEDSIQWEL